MVAFFATCDCCHLVTFGPAQVVLISSMGGTDPENMLNKLVGEDGGQILQWKRRAEQYLIASGVNYTIIHPGGGWHGGVLPELSSCAGCNLLSG